MGGLVRRQTETGSKTCLKGYGGRDYIKSAAFDASSLPGASRGTSEVQTVTITGTPTGGTFTLTFRGATTTAIAYNAAASAVEDALEALVPIGAGNVRVTGGPGPGTPYVVTFLGDRAGQDLPMMTHTDSLTGGTSPAVAVTETTKGASMFTRITIGSGDLPGTIVTKVPGDTTKIRRYTAASGEAIFGIVDGEYEFLDNSSAGNRDIPVHTGPGCVFDKSLIRDGVTYSSALTTWAGTTANQIQ